MHTIDLLRDVFYKLLFALGGSWSHTPSVSPIAVSPLKSAVTSL